MKRQTILLLLASAAMSASATDLNIEGRWLVHGTPQASLASTCDLNIYGAENAASPLWTTNGVRFATDSAGYFVVTASAKPPVALPDTFWVGVKPAERDEIVPRFRVAPVPFAFAADEVRLIKSDGTLTLTGTATIERLAVSNDVEVDDWIVPSGGSVNARNLQIDNVRLTGLTLAGAGLLNFFRDPALSASYDYDTFDDEYSISATAPVHAEYFGLSLYLDSSSALSRKKWAFDSDGFLMIAIKADPRKCPAPLVMIKVGHESILPSVRIGTDGSGVYKPSAKRFMTVPYRAGENVEVMVSAIGAGRQPAEFFLPLPSVKEEWSSNIGVKLRLVRFGRD